ncbi:MAG: hypothetical protein ACHQ0I_04750 [Candidatus Lutacidiplasmatales archaeon]
MTVTDDPEVPRGTLNVHVNAPVASVVRDPLSHELTVWESKTSDARVVDTEKPLPVTVTVEPEAPWEGLTTMAGAVTRNKCTTERALEAVSSAPTEYGPAALPGIVKVHTKPPWESVERDVPTKLPAVQLRGVWSDAAKVTVAPRNGANPEPVTVYVPPIGP